MQAPTGRTDASQSSGDLAPQAPTGSNTVVVDAIDKALDLTNTLAAIVKEVAEVLQHAPYVKTLTGVILQFIKSEMYELKTNKERCREIIDKVLNLSHWIYEKLAAIAKTGERANENLAQVKNSLIFCASTLTNVLGELEKHQARPKLAKFVSRGVEDLNKLDRSVDNLEKRLLRDMVFDIKLQQGMPVSSENTDPASHPSAEGRDHVLPPKPYLIVEREAQVDTALHILLSAEPSRIAILGGGGFGKTTLARAILHDPKIAERYQSRYFLSCEGMTDVDALLLGIASMLGITATLSAALASIRSLLAASTTLLCLDNFETPWEPSATRTQVEGLLASIADIPNLSLIITTRGTQRPSKVAWSHPLLPPLSTVSSESARKILHTICGPDHIIDEPTQNLLDAVDGIPLAITLISNLLRDGETSHSLWTRWLKNETEIVENGGDDRESNLNASITLSVNSPRIKKDPGAIALLATLSLLPDGFPFAAIEQLGEYLGINDIHKAVQTLRAVALIKPHEAISSPRIQMLSPIRLFCNEFLSPETLLVLEKVANYYITIMLRDTDYTDAVIYAQVVPEILNVHSVFQRVFNIGYSQDITHLISATSSLTYWSHYIGYVSQDTIQMALEISVNVPIPHAKCLISLGDLHQTEGQHTKAKTCFREAATIFKQAKYVYGEAMALERSGAVLFCLGQHDQSEVAFKTSLELYTQTGNKWGQAQVRKGLGNLYMYQDRDSEAQVTLSSALEAYQQISNLIGQGNVAQCLSNLHFNRGNLVKAEKYASEALNAAKHANDAVGEGNALQKLGNIYLAQDRVSEARQALERALIIFKQQNDPINQLNAIKNLAEVYIRSDQLSAAEALFAESSKVELDVVQIPFILTQLGWLYICGARFDKAETLLDDALERFQRFDHKDGQAKVLGHLGTVYFKTNQLDEAERALKSIPDLGTWIDHEIHRLWVLGDLYIIKEELEDAQPSLNAAMAECKNGGEFLYSYQQGNILRSMGTLHVKQSRADLAIDKFKEAREFHRKAQWVSEQATDLKRLGEAYEMLERAEEAGAAFREAEELMESVREARTLKE
ncbi:hypothetical protein BJ912DRAFT_1140585 [Pholiota molesta]|nr:hypothetical protein BJ912DRAFT_1140585 [Pholiota molesta]